MNPFEKTSYAGVLLLGLIFLTSLSVYSIKPEDLDPVSPGKRTSARYSWESQMARATETGDLQWTPKPFLFKAGRSIRYIDFENGNDNNNGTSKSSAWKHHPWDPASTGISAQCKGIQTFVFKGGSVYRGKIEVKESGVPGNPIRFTADPSWGAGEAAIYGSEKITGGWKKGADNKDIPDASQVWYRDLDFAPRTLWMVKNKDVTRIPIARMPNWKVTDPEDVKSEWWSWDYPGSKYFSVFMKNEQGKELILGIDTKHITGPRELYMGAIAWTEFGWVDGTPYPSYVQGFDAEKKGIGFEGYLGSAASRLVARHHRYYLEDKPHYLDDPEGEFWFDKKGTGGRLYVILPKNQDPNSAVLEAGKETTLISMEDKNNIDISGLTFRFTNCYWNLTELPSWDKDGILKRERTLGSVRILGGASEIHVSNCAFEHVNYGVFMKAIKPGFSIDKVSVNDCLIRYTDNGGIAIQEGNRWGQVYPEEFGHLYDVKILRNHISHTGFRTQRSGGSTNAIDVMHGQTVEVAGNIIETPWHAGVNVRCAKQSNNLRDIPLSRVLIYQNKVTDGIRTGDDCGNIETWQGGSAYVYNNLSGNPGGFRNAGWMVGKDDPNRPGSARFGMAYYLDGSFKNYFFNNIGYGLSKDPWSKVGATTMFQEIISYQNSFFNNTAYNFVKGTRRQAPHAGSNKFLGNIWDGIGDWVFWHTTPARSAAAGNENDAGPQQGKYALETNAFTGNIFHDITGKYGSFKPSGQWHETFEDARDALRETNAIVSDLGEVTSVPPMKDPGKRDFSLANTSLAVDKGARVFVPWSLYATVGEWGFYPAGDDHSRILDEHWYMTPYYFKRDDYFKVPMFHLKGVNFEKTDYVQGPLEDWTKGALRFNGRNQYAVCSNADLNQTFKLNLSGPGIKTDNLIFKGKDFKSPQVYDSNLLIEVYFRTEMGFTDGLMVEKMKDSGYSLVLNKDGGVTFTVSGNGKTARISSRVAVNDGKWHHLIAEADRSGKILTLYLNGEKEIQGAGISKEVSLENTGDLYAGGTPSGRYFNGAFDFLRICHGTLADAKTNIEELYAWEFDGPFLRDFAGRSPKGKRDAGALEK